MKKVYLDYAATTPLEPRVFEAMMPYLQDKFGNPSSIHSWGREARQAVEESREKVAAVLGCQPKEVLLCGAIAYGETRVLCVNFLGGLVHVIDCKT